MRPSDQRKPKNNGTLLPLLAAAPIEPMRVGAIMALVTAILAVQAIEADLLPYAPDPALAPDAPDPVVATVGEQRLRVSDLRAQAGDASGRSADLLVRQGYLDDAAQQLALAQAAEEDGLDEALEVRAALALARRRVLSEAYLDLAVSRAVTPEAVQAAYAREAQVAQTHDRISVRRLVTTTEEGARAARRRLDRGERLAGLAASLSIAPTAKADQGSSGFVHPSALPDDLAALAARTPMGELAGPVLLAEGWTIFRVDARRQVAMPSFAEREPALRASLKAEAMAAAASRAERLTRTERRALSLISDRPVLEDDGDGSAEGGRDGGDGGGALNPGQARLP